LGVLGLDRLKLDGNLFTRDNISAEVDVTEAATSDLTTDAVLVADAKIHSSHIEVELWTLGIGLSDTRVDVDFGCRRTIDGVDRCRDIIVGSDRIYLCPRVKVVVAGPDREWLVVLMIDAAVIQAGGRRVVTLSTAR
jgi:hypothetical protein